MTSKVWNLVYRVGNTPRIASDAGNPQQRASALEGAEKIAANGWDVWVEHHVSKKRIFDSKAVREAAAAKVAPVGAAAAPVDCRKLSERLLDAVVES